MSEGDAVGNVGAFAIGAAMGHGGAHAFQDRHILWKRAGKAANTAHGETPSSCLFGQDGRYCKTSLGLAMVRSTKKQQSIEEDAEKCSGFYTRSPRISSKVRVRWAKACSPAAESGTLVMMTMR